MKDESFRPNRVLSYFQEEWKTLFFVAVSGLIYNLGLLAGPWFEGKMTGKLVDLLGGTGTFQQMLMLVTAYVVSIGSGRFPAISNGSMSEDLPTTSTGI